ncbi:MAG: antibiotic biosynthesis monooxygenase [Verrucomicrobium sp.]|nr:antibiotic biosynthesis monooxygenase [Verrucomicrobium sp.]
MKALLLATALFAAFYAAAPAAPAPQAVVAVIHVDVMPDFTQAASGLLDQFRRDSLREKGAESFQVLQETVHANHFTLVETWADQATYDTHAYSAAARAFREKLQPMLGSPFDERLHRVRP